MQTILALVAVAHCTGAHGETARPVNYTDDIRPILEARCVQCHQPSRIAPMSLRTYQEVRPWAAAIAREVGQRRMPPFHAAGPIGSFKDDIRLTDDEVRQILQWIDSGAPQGPPAPVPLPAPTASQEWSTGEPDIVIDFPDYLVASNTVDTDPYAYLFTDFVFDDDLWISGYEWKFSDYRVVHHAFASALAPGTPIPEGRIIPNLSVPVKTIHGISSWFPGQAEKFYPEGTAALIRRGVRPVLTIHYAPSSESVLSRTQIGVYLYDGELKDHFQRLYLSVENQNLVIEPNEPNHQRTVNNVFPADAMVHSYYVHMHYRGKAAQILFRYPDGTSEVAFDLPQYSFDWQRVYELAEPVLAPAGTAVEAVLAWDNSANNPLNPDPAQRVVFGPSSRDEMGGIQLTISSAGETTETLHISRGKASIPISELPDHFLPAHEKAIRDALQKMSPEERDRLIQKALEADPHDP